MKALSLVLAGALSLILGACATWGLLHGGVNIHETYVEIQPGVKFTSTDRAQLDQILCQYQNKLYKIKDSDNGRLVFTQGRLNDIFVRQTFLADVAKAESNGISYSAIQIGAAEHGWHPPGQIGAAEHGWHPPARPEHGWHPAHGWHPPSLTEEYLRQCREMVERVTPILKKYSRD